MTAGAGRATLSCVMYEWETFGHRYRLCRGRAPVEGWEALSPLEARWALRAQLNDRIARQALIRAALGPGETMRSTSLAEPGVMEREVDQRRLTVLHQHIAPPVLRHGPASRQPVALPPVPEPRREAAWVDITVVDDRVPAQPLARTQFRLTLPGGAVREGALNGQAHLRVDDIEPGKCWLELSNLELDRDA